MTATITDLPVSRTDGEPQTPRLVLPAVTLPRIPLAYVVVAAGWAIPVVLAVLSGSVVVWAALAVGGAVATTVIAYAEPRFRSLECDSFDRGLRAGIHVVELRDGETF